MAILYGRPARTVRRSDGMIEYRDPATGQLLAVYDPVRQVMQFQRRSRRTLASLAGGDEIDKPAQAVYS